MDMRLQPTKHSAMLLRPGQPRYCDIVISKANLAAKPPHFGGTQWPNSPPAFLVGPGRSFVDWMVDVPGSNTGLQEVRKHRRTKRNRDIGTSQQNPNVAVVEFDTVWSCFVCTLRSLSCTFSTVHYIWNWLGLNELRKVRCANCAWGNLGALA